MFANPYMISRCVAYLYEGQKPKFKVIVSLLYCIAKRRTKVFLQSNNSPKLSHAYLISVRKGHAQC